MTDARDELAELILSDLMARAHRDDWGVPCVYPENISGDLADAIIAAGWSSRTEKILDAMGAWDDE